MCDCIQQFEEGILSQPIKGKKVLKAEIVTAAIMFRSGTIQTISQAEVSLEGQKKKVIRSLIHNFCPFCGIKY